MESYYVPPRELDYYNKPDKRWWRKGKVISGFEAMVKYPEMFKRGPVNAKPWTREAKVGSLAKKNNRRRRAIRANECEIAKIEVVHHGL